MGNLSHRLIILSGPSCVGKSPLDKALKRIYPGIREKLQPLILYNSREPRPGEQDGVDYYFASRESIQNMAGDDRYVVMDVRGDLQALDLEELEKFLKKGDVFFEGNPFTGKILLTHHKLQDVNKLSVFMSPLSAEEIRYFSDPETNVFLPVLLTDIMRRKLLRRTRKQKGELSLRDLENIEKRAESTYREVREAHHFDYVIPNHDGEDSEHWDAFYYPIGEARKSLETFVALLKGEKASWAEKWTAGTLP